MNIPMISVLMPVYNEEKYLSEAIDSILNQTYTDFEFIILNDGSTDRTEDIILSYDDPRIVYVKNTENLQIVKTLNKGINLAKGKYIARMDADDISFPDRFEKQIEFMQKNSDIDVSGSFIEHFGSKKGIMHYPLTHEEIKAHLLFNSVLAHPTVMAKKIFYHQFKYEEEYNKAEDYALWVKGIEIFKFSNFGMPLLKYRNHEKQTNLSFQRYQASQVRKMMLKIFKPNATKEDCLVMDKIATNEYIPINNAEQLFEKLLAFNKIHHVIEQEILKKVLLQRYWWMINSNTSQGLVLFKDFWNSSLKEWDNLSFYSMLKFFIKCAIRYRHEQLGK
jgi:glycosyltransferase involved in cell wall biosynthesis